PIVERARGSSLYCEAVDGSGGQSIASGARLGAVGKSCEAGTIVSDAIALEGFDIAPQIGQLVVGLGGFGEHLVGAVLTVGGTDLNDPAAGRNGVRGVGAHHVDLQPFRTCDRGGGDQYLSGLRGDIRRCRPQLHGLGDPGADGVVGGIDRLVGRHHASGNIGGLIESVVARSGGNVLGGYHLEG